MGALGSWGVGDTLPGAWGCDVRHSHTARLCVFVSLPVGVLSAGEGVEVEVEVGKSERLSGAWWRIDPFFEDFGNLPYKVWHFKYGTCECPLGYLPAHFDGIVYLRRKPSFGGPKGPLGAP
jgi:hypothetical protein